ncbi:DUF2264 domain-containing protein [Chitinophagaceae bacterium LB-8]|uniref:DUF2264 domain-containing protein n=1 Tax=Paraflavisolibacter caeni TaxID=2982496 RepID=A0A9X3BG31_9BACT|nr:DUF2264 domain-containing protein [Paraflavisolibacter caeni]MCU7550179.1 DUF2264 domain-containing protein [Paraflavisolibacter caeni]
MRIHLRTSTIVRTFLATLCCLILFSNSHAQATKNLSDRKVWLDYMDKIARPVMQNLAADQLKKAMSVNLSPKIDNAASRAKVAYLEAFGRTICGIAPWLNTEGGTKEEVALRNQYREWTLKAIANAVNPVAMDYMVWNVAGQQLVDASFLAFALIRSPWLWEHLDQKVKGQVVDALKLTRNFVPVYSNWILFSGMIEAFFCKYGFEYDKVRVEYGIREFAQHWYTGDGMFSDGMNFNFDYYNSFVIQPYLACILEVTSKQTKSYDFFLPKLDKISKRYAEIQERLINADGSYPVTGRSIVYRGAAFHHLADMVLRKQLPASLQPSQVRGALTAVIKKTIGAPLTFTKDGWLNMGVYGNQPGLADSYITTGSLYLCSTIFLPLGLPESDEFWSAPAQPWTSVKVWTGQDAPADHALELH